MKYQLTIGDYITIASLRKCLKLIVKHIQCNGWAHKVELLKADTGEVVFYTK